ncbi:MAG: PQQ-binding-like beta-propeller repeat protein [Alphaproteobacteria bacterium]|nr:PQQ-binding-like beta-propeller repeat protein [Alphaproteobacteria bacterium]
MISGKRFSPLLFAVCLGGFALTGCSSVSGWFDNDEPPPLEGERISVLALQKELEPDNMALDVQGLVAPPEWRNEFWPQAGGYPNHAMQNLELSHAPLKMVWKASIGKGSTKELPLTAQPILVDGTIFTLDSQGRLSAFDTETGRHLWSGNISDPDEDDPVIGGGLAFSAGILYATNGFDEVLAINPLRGDIIWRKDISAPARAAPTIVDNRIFVTTLDNKMIALSALDGTFLWEHLGLSETAGLIGAASPAAGRDIVVPVFSSGEITALRVENGSVAWSDNLSGIRGLGGLSDLSDIRAMPVMDKELIFAISYSGRLVAIDKRTGTRVWQREIGGSQTPWLAGNHLFVLSSDNQLIALGRDTGTIRWITDLPRLDDDDPVILTGPVLAGGRLIVMGTDGRVFDINPEDGALLKEWSIGRDVAISPIIAAGVLYVLAEDGTLMAFK